MTKYDQKNVMGDDNAKIEQEDTYENKPGKQGESYITNKTVKG